MSARQFSVIIPHYNQPDALRRCLGSLEAQSFARSAFEIIVVDNASHCDLTPIAREFPDAIFLTEENRGAAHARNRGLEAASGENIAFIDADCVADRDWLSAGLEALERTDLVGGAVLVTVENKSSPSAIEAFEQVFAFRQRSYIERKHFAVTANLFATSRAVEAIGPFKNGVSEDVDWCHRARALGFRLAFNDRSIISHPARKEWRELVSKWERLTLERWNGLEKRGNLRTVHWSLLAVATVLSIAPHGLAILFTRRISGRRNKANAIRTLAQIRAWRARRMFALL